MTVTLRYLVLSLSFSYADTSCCKKDRKNADLLDHKLIICLFAYCTTLPASCHPWLQVQLNHYTTSALICTVRLLIETSRLKSKIFTAITL
jgi:hypothetical protein